MSGRRLTLNEFLRKTVPPLAMAARERLLKRRDELRAQLKLRRTGGGSRQSGKTLLLANLREVDELITCHDAVIADARTVRR
jgi:hypothetical protein